MSRILTGDRPTGALHLGHYFGTLANRVRLQREGHELFVVVADYQVITDRDHPGDLRDDVDVSSSATTSRSASTPTTTVFFPHSAVPALNQLLLPFLSLVGMGELERNPTVKDEIRNCRSIETVSGLMFTYPVHQAADILFCKGELVPVGPGPAAAPRARRAASRAASTSATRRSSRCREALLGEAPVLHGLDGRKMSKSLGNAIALSDDRATRSPPRSARARTDSERTITFEPERRPEVANLLTIAALCSGRTPEAIAAEVGAGGARRVEGAHRRGRGRRRCSRRSASGGPARPAGSTLRRAGTRCRRPRRRSPKRRWPRCAP